jgi:hypothetical protein
MENKYDWQPIETVPRDGTIIDLWHKNGFCEYEEWWDSESDCFANCNQTDSYTHWRNATGLTPPGCEDNAL